MTNIRALPAILLALLVSSCATTTYNDISFKDLTASGWTYQKNSKGLPVGGSIASAIYSDTGKVSSPFPLVNETTCLVTDKPGNNTLQAKRGDTICFGQFGAYKQ